MERNQSNTKTKQYRKKPKLYNKKTNTLESFYFEETKATEFRVKKETVRLFVISVVLLYSCQKTLSSV